MPCERQWVEDWLGLIPVKVRQISRRKGSSLQFVTTVIILASSTKIRGTDSPKRWRTFVALGRLPEQIKLFLNFCRQKECRQLEVYHNHPLCCCSVKSLLAPQKLSVIFYDELNLTCAKLIKVCRK